MNVLPITNRLARSVLQKSTWVEAQHPRGKDGQWIVKVDAVKGVAERMGIELPIKIDISGRQKSTWGYHEMTAIEVDGKRTLGHKISLKRGISPEQASRTLYHELGHAKQHERVRTRRRDMGVKVGNELRRRLNAGSYDRRLSEVGARAHEKLHDVHGPLTESTGVEASTTQDLIDNKQKLVRRYARAERAHRERREAAEAMKQTDEFPGTGNIAWWQASESKRKEEASVRRRQKAEREIERLMRRASRF